MRLPDFLKHGSARMERGTIAICIFSIFSIFVQDVPYYNHAAGSQASMITGKNLALINLRGVVSSQRLRGVVIDTTLLATGSSYGKTPCPHHEGGNHLIVSERRTLTSRNSQPSSTGVSSDGRRQRKSPAADAAEHYGCDLNAPATEAAEHYGGDPNSPAAEVAEHPGGDDAEMKMTAVPTVNPGKIIDTETIIDALTLDPGGDAPRFI